MAHRRSLRGRGAVFGRLSLSVSRGQIDRERGFAIGRKARGKTSYLSSGHSSEENDCGGAVAGRGDIDETLGH